MVPLESSESDDEAMTSALLGIPDTYDDGQGDSLSPLDLGLCDVRDMDVGFGF
jgi:hypothetical protein